MIVVPSLAVTVTKLHCNNRQYLSLHLDNKVNGVFPCLDAPADTIMLIGNLLFSEYPFCLMSLKFTQ